MTEEAPSASLGRKDLIYKPKDNDVLLGRGYNTNLHVGNERFRLIVAERKLEYNTSRKRFRKKEIAREVFDAVHASGARFLKQVEYSGPENDEEVEAWFEVQVSDALEKCKQALREKPKSKKRGIGVDTDESTKRDDSRAFSHGVPVSSLPSGTAGLPPVSGHGLSSTLTPVLPPMLTGEQPYCVSSHFGLFWDTRQVVPPSMIHPLSLSYPGAARTGGLLQGMHHQPEDVSASLAEHFLISGLQGLSFPCSTEQLQHQLARNGRTSNGNGLQGIAPGAAHLSSTLATSDCDEGTRQVSNDKKDLLSVLQEPDLPMFTEEQAAAEQASLTDEERVEALMDMFGKCCTVQQGKRAKRDLDSESIQFLINQMRLEIDRIPEIKKRALLEAQTRCDAAEFSDSRLEQFLRCQDMDPKLGAQRFVNYWSSRREVFGPEMYLRRMTLSEALSDDDIVALESGLACTLPGVDCSGRQVMLFVTCRDTRDGYTLENLLRAYWYVMEVIAQDNKDVRSGFVQVIWDRDTTIGDYDLRFYERLIRFDRTVWPVRIISFHNCCPPWLTVKVLKPIMTALLDKKFRARMTIHDVPESQVLGALTNFGIPKEMLPTGMGGTLKFSMTEWIANRRGVELEEI